MDYTILKSYQGLSLRIQKLDQKILEEENRLSFLAKHRDIKLKQIKSDEIEYLQLEKKKDGLESEVSQLYERMDKLKRDEKDIKTMDMLSKHQAQIKSINESITILEDEILSLYETLDSLQTQIHESKDFNTGSLQSLKELKEEVSQATTLLNTDRNSLLERQDKIIKPFSDTIKKRVLYLHNKYSGIIYSVVSDQNCSYCKQLLTSKLCQEVYQSKSLTYCPNCQLILIGNN